MKEKWTITDTECLNCEAPATRVTSHNTDWVYCQVCEKAFYDGSSSRPLSAVDYSFLDQILEELIA